MKKDIVDKYFKKLYTSKSNIAGIGLFAGEFIKAGEIILIFGGNLAISDSRYSGDFMRSTCIGLNENIILGETFNSEKELSDFINHSCDPNAGLQDAVTLIAIKDIPMGTEIVSDYAFWENNVEWKMSTMCNCETENCRGTITGNDWKLFSTQNTNFKYFSPYLKRRIVSYEK